MTVAATPAEAQVEEPTPPKRSRHGLPAVLGSGWAPVVVLVAVVEAVLIKWGVSPWDTIAFAAYTGLGISLPGTLLYRAVTTHRRTLAEDLAVGTCLGYLIEILVYVLGRSVGAPLLVLAWPALTLILFAAVPSLRRHWRAADRLERSPTWSSWLLAAAVGALVLYSASSFFRMSGLDGASVVWGDLDMTFHLALAGELKHHVPPHVPYTGDRLLYYWFYYADLAATSWATGIEPLVLLRRLSLLPAIAATVVLIAVAGRRLTGRQWTGPVAVVVTYFVLAPNPYGWTVSSWLTDFGFGMVDDGTQLRLSMWQSPTQTFGAMFFAAVVLVVIDLLQGNGGRARWLLLTGLALATGGSKATFLPMLIAGAMSVALVELTLRRRLHRTALGIAAVGLGCFVFVQVVLLGMASGGLALGAWESLRFYGIEAGTGVLMFASSALPWVALGAVTVLCWLLIWCALVGLAWDRPVLRPDVTMLLGIGLSAIGASILLHHQGLGETYFLQGGRPYLSLAAVCGLAAVLSRSALPRRTPLMLVGAGLAGAVSIYVLRLVGPQSPPSYGSLGGRRLLVIIGIWWPYLVLIGLIAAVVVAMVILRRRVPMARGVSLGIVLSLMMGFGLESAIHDRMIATAANPPGRGWLTDPGPVISPGGLDAARWLRDHSAPEDLVATNAHCAPGSCLNLHFWITGLSERRVLVEGWGYTVRAHADAVREGVNNALVGFHDPQRLADNDAAFTSPSPESISRLRDGYGVRWLFVDRSQGSPSRAIGQFATLRFASGTCEVYELA